MKRSLTIRRMGWTHVLLFVIAMSMVIAACSSDDSGTEGADEVALIAIDGASTEVEAPSAGGGEGAYRAVAEDGVVIFEESVSSFDAKVIRDGSVDLRIEPGSFGVSSAQIRQIAADLGGYVASGESRVEQFDDERYASGWFTIRIPSDRFDDAVERVEALGERVSASLSSQDVTEEYVDLEGRLNYWREQEAFYARLMQEATTIEELVTVQTRMQDVLLNIEQIEGRLRYLDSRTDFATLTVGLTEVPDTTVAAVVPADDGPIAEAFDQAGEVLLATVSFIIVAAAVAIPLAILVLIAYGVYRLFGRSSRKQPAEV
jgi:hypothetical protein